MSAFRVFSGTPATRLPRVFCYFDDIVWPERACYNEFTGEYLAIREFNEQRALQEYCMNIRRNAPLGENEMPL
jgi:hypothetical protein